VWRVSLVFIAAQLLAQQRPLDLVLLAEGAPGVQLSVSPATFTTAPADRVAVVRFAKRSHVQQPFTTDVQKIMTAIYRINGQARVPVAAVRPSSATQHHLFRAVMDAIDLFAPSSVGLSRQRTIIAVFATDDASAVPTGDEVKKALLAAGIKFFGIAIPRRDDCCPLSRVQTPPTVPGNYTLMRAPLPEATMKRVAALAAATGGRVSTESADIFATFARLRSNVQPPNNQNGN
jgi:hypothetical protein